MWWIILAVLAVAFLAFVGVVLMQPSAFRINRSASMAAPPLAPFAQVNDFHNWTNWSPWEDLDPNLRRSYEGPSSGEGAIYSWEGNKNVGSGRMTILESLPHEYIQIKLEFLKPFAATNTAEFTFKPEGERTRVDWTMSGENDNFMKKAFGLMMNMDKMVGKDFEKGLDSMRQTVESDSRKKG
ncbi:MAG: SRPBCC family protein [Candidatus Omnitrophica bacterium]|nr:SRPBCC family protein [Candidatus Omnitrophota bacterium]